MMVRQTCAGLACVVAVAFCCTSSVLAQAWPSKPIRLIVPFASGGPTDQVARRLAGPLSDALGQPVIVENIAGASGAIGMARAVKAPADGYTLVLGANSTMTVVPNISKLPYDTTGDLQAIGGRVKFAYVLVANPIETAVTATDLVKRSKTMPNGISYGSAGAGSGGHLIAELLREKTGARFVHVPYKGVALAQTDLVGGHLGFMFDALGSALPMVKAGKLRALGVTGSSRSPQLPGVPTLSESVPGFESVGWYAFFSPKGLPPLIVQRFNTEMAKIYHTAEYAEFLQNAGYEATFEPPEALTNVVIKETVSWASIVRSAGIQLE